MAGPVAHIYCAVALLNSGALDVKDQCAYVRGTSFNDIRYLNVISREETHDESVTFTKIKQTTNDFEKGMLVHTLLDINRENYVRSQKLYDRMPAMKFKTQVLKFSEDKMLYDKMKTLLDPVKCFNKVDADERKFLIAEDKIELWHMIMREYLNDRPSDAQIGEFLNYIINQDYEKESSYFERIFDSIRKFFVQLLLQYRVKNALHVVEKDEYVTKKLQNFYDNCVNNLVNK